MCMTLLLAALALEDHPAPRSLHRQKTQLSVKIVFQVKISRKKEVEKGNQKLESLQRIRNLDDKWQ